MKDEGGRMKDEHLVPRFVARLSSHLLGYA